MVESISGRRQERLITHQQDIITKDITERHSVVFERQLNRPAAMAYFDKAALSSFTSRIDELKSLKENGTKIVGTFCTFVPEEIIVAAGAVPIRLSTGSALSIADAEVILPRDICPMIKSFSGFIMAKDSFYARLVDFLVGETTCDGKKKVWEIMQHYVPVHVMELPQKKVLASRELWTREVFCLKERLEIETGNRITADALRSATRMINAKRVALERFDRLRRKAIPPISGKDASLVYQVALLDDIERFTARVEMLCDELDERAGKGEGVADPSTPRIMVMGCPMVMPDWKLHDIIETSGAVVVCDDSCSGARYHVDPIVDWSVDTLVMQIKSIAERYLNIPCPCFTPGYCGKLQAMQMAESHKVDGVVYYVLQFCHGFNLEYHKYERYMNESGIPVLKIQTDYNTEDLGQLKTRIEAFLETISKIH